MVAHIALFRNHLLTAGTGSKPDWIYDQRPENWYMDVTPDCYSAQSLDLGTEGHCHAADQPTPKGWVDVLVDCPGAQGLYIYAVPPHLTVQPGDILTVPFGAQQVGAIAVHRRSSPPVDLEASQIRWVEEVVSQGFFPADYWTLLRQVADYYCTPLMQVIRVALPPGLLRRSQRRIRQVTAPSLQNSPQTTPAQHLLAALAQSKTRDLTWQFLQQRVRGAASGLRELQQSGLVESYLAMPSPVRPKLQQAVTLTTTLGQAPLSPRQQEVLEVLKAKGGELWMTELLQLCRVSASVVKTLAHKGYVVIQPRELLRSEVNPVLPRDQPKLLNADQRQAVATITSLSGYAQVLLHGVTGSGKTEVYLQAIAPVLSRQQSVLILVPEIGLTPQLTDRLRQRFAPSSLLLYHSGLADGERYDTWRQMLQPNPRIVLGTRSAIFAPLTNLGLIILDEEHDDSFKQDQPAPCYHARTVAQWRAALANCPLVLGSATPSLESWVACGGPGILPLPSTSSLEHAAAVSVSQASPPALGSDRGLRCYLSLPKRIHDRPLPPMTVVDMRQEFQQGNRSIFSRQLQQALIELQANRQQGILFIHRRGHSTFVACRNCGYVLDCPHCDVSLAYHHTHAQASPLLRCHYCNFTQLHPSHCPQCNSPYLKHFGSGTQRVVQELARLLPDLRCLRYDSDTTRTKGAHRALMSQFAQGDADVLVGTQMLTKGIDLPQVTLVGILAADGLLHLADYRASERSYQTLTQVAGRSGRGDHPGQVILQTYNPDHPVIRAVQRQCYAAFAEAELAMRASFHYPPLAQLALVRLSSPNPTAVEVTAHRCADLLQASLGPQPNCQIMGAVPAPILRVADRYRWQILIKCWGSANLSSLLAAAMEPLRAACPTSVSFTIDIDPLHLG